MVLTRLRLSLSIAVLLVDLLQLVFTNAYYSAVSSQNFLSCSFTFKAFFTFYFVPSPKFSFLLLEFFHILQLAYTSSSTTHSYVVVPQPLKLSPILLVSLFRPSTSTPSVFVLLLKSTSTRRILLTDHPLAILWLSFAVLATNLE